MSSKLRDAVYAYFSWIKELRKAPKTSSFLDIIGQLGISEENWLRFGTIWREIAAMCPHQENNSRSLLTTFLKYTDQDLHIQANLRKCDQFIDIEDLPALMRRVLKVSSMEIPMIQLYEEGTIKLHRLDVALELFERLKPVKRMSPKDKIIFLEEIRYHLEQRFPTRSMMKSYVNGTSNMFFKINKMALPKDP
ncbi:Oidioi.mRNA.OKI2018_I69.chr2.g5576.t1.cds [Oikopleura dioica]|uniref:Oidioi.mRNA.OKI2018_I69.chr2.g5576.t1.cds n=1 Tax=Oikopleura dioica TaxID=34765 RepID=A0ABN7T0V1_OIKDI|nr:Oidioi.mRNA.OKI2018_I69.chr2.g5576.t1.cds [Oikopleura dioica]